MSAPQRSIASTNAARLERLEHVGDAPARKLLRFGDAHDGDPCRGVVVIGRALERLIGVVHGEAESFVERDGRSVVCVDVQHRGGRAVALKMLQAGQRERSTEAQAVEVGVHGDHVDLADVRRVQLGPAERCQAVVALVEQEAVGAEPGFELALLQGGDVPATLLAVPGERGVVDFQPRVLVDADSERARGHVGDLCHRKRRAHLQ
jgi:hypothetical protein